MKDLKYYIFAIGVLIFLSIIIGLGINKAKQHLPKITVTTTTVKRLPQNNINKDVFIPANTQEQNLAADMPKAPTEVDTVQGQLPNPSDDIHNPYNLDAGLSEPPSSVVQESNGKMRVEASAADSAATYKKTEATPAANIAEPKPSGTIVKINTSAYPKSGKAEDLYKASLPAIAKILKAQKEYFAATKDFADEPEKLGLQFAEYPNSVQVDKVNIIRLNNDFIYMFGPSFVTIYYNAPKSAQERYNLDFFYNGDITCYARTVQAGETCRNLGGDFPRANLVKPSIIEYMMPADFIEKNI